MPRYPKAYRLSDFAEPANTVCRARRPEVTKEVRAAIVADAEESARRHGVPYSVVMAIMGCEGYEAGYKDGKSEQIPLRYRRAAALAVRIAADLHKQGLCVEAIAKRLDFPPDDLRRFQADMLVTEQGKR